MRMLSSLTIFLRTLGRGTHFLALVCFNQSVLRRLANGVHFCFARPGRGFLLFGQQGRTGQRLRYSRIFYPPDAVVPSSAYQSDETAKQCRCRSLSQLYCFAYDTINGECLCRPKAIVSLETQLSTTDRICRIGDCGMWAGHGTSQLTNWWWSTCWTIRGECGGCLSGGPVCIDWMAASALWTWWSGTHLLTLGTDVWYLLSWCVVKGPN